MDCCDKKDKKESRGVISGLMYGLIPHTGCIAFIIFTILGVTAATSIFKPLLLNASFFYILIVLSLIFVTISAGIYLKKNSKLSLEGVKKKWKYLSVLYGTTVFVNLILFMVIFPIATNIISASPTGLSVEDNSKITLKVNIPCPGHAPLISQELKTIEGVGSAKFSFPNYFDVNFNSQTSKNEILSLDVFKTYNAKIVKESIKESTSQQSCCVSAECGSSRTGTCGCGA